jgi:hypothetical protein
MESPTVSSSADLVVRQRLADEVALPCVQPPGRATAAGLRFRCLRPQFEVEMCASPITARMIAAESALRPMSLTNDLSILILSTGNARSERSDE